MKTSATLNRTSLRKQGNCRLIGGGGGGGGSKSEKETGRLKVELPAQKCSWVAWLVAVWARML